MLHFASKKRLVLSETTVPFYLISHNEVDTSEKVGHTNRCDDPNGTRQAVPKPDGKDNCFFAK